MAEPLYSPLTLLAVRVIGRFVMANSAPVKLME